MPVINEKSAWESYTYASQRLIFTKYEADSSVLSISVKIQRNENPAVDQYNMATRVFRGKFFIETNYMNDKIQIDQLYKLNNCHFIFDRLVRG